MHDLLARYFPIRLEILRVLTQDGRNIQHLEEDIGNGHISVVCWLLVHVPLAVHNQSNVLLNQICFTSLKSHNIHHICAKTSNL